MSRSSIQDTLSLGDPAQLWNFDFFIPVVPGASDTRHLTFRCQTTDLPGTALEPLEVSLHGHTIQYAGRRIYTHTINVQFLETFDWATRALFTNWIEIARSWRNNSGSYFSTYAVSGLIVLYDDIPQPVRTTQLNYMWPESISEIQLDGSQSGAVQLSIAFRYTDWQDV